MGIQNYIKVFQESELRKAIGNTFLYTFVVVVFKNLWAAAGAGIQFKFKNKKLFKSGYFLTLYLSSVVIGLVFVPILHPYGFFKYLFEAAYLGFMAQNWLTNVNIVMLSIAGVSIWQWTGYHMVIYLAYLQGISKEYYEASLIDGANAFQRFRKYICLCWRLPSISILF